MSKVSIRVGGRLKYKSQSSDMIKRVSIEIIDHGLSNFDLPYKAIIGREYYVKFVRAAKRLYLCYEFLDEAMLMECNKCHSFTAILILAEVVLIPFGLLAPVAITLCN